MRRDGEDCREGILSMSVIPLILSIPVGDEQQREGNVRSFEGRRVSVSVDSTCSQKTKN